MSENKQKFIRGVTLVAVGVAGVIVGISLQSNDANLQQSTNVASTSVGFTIGAPEYGPLYPDLMGLSLDSSFSDVTFKLGAPTNCSVDDVDDDVARDYFDFVILSVYDWSEIITGEAELSDAVSCTWENSNNRIKPLGRNFEVLLEKGEIRGFEVFQPAAINFQTVQGMNAEIGFPADLVSTSKNLVSRVYTYIEGAIQFNFNANRLVSFTIKDNVQWASYGRNTLEYSVQGRKICPGAECPWDEDGLKPEYENASYRDFLPD